MEPQKLFILLESNNLHECEEAKKRLTENFSASESFLIILFAFFDKSFFTY